MTEVSMSPLPVQSMMSITFGLPSVVTCRPAAPGSTPESKMAMIWSDSHIEWGQLGGERMTGNVRERTVPRPS